jgi:hypothetical protein
MYRWPPPGSATQCRPWLTATSVAGSVVSSIGHPQPGHSSPSDAEEVAAAGTLSVQPVEVQRLALYAAGDRPSMVEVHGARITIAADGTVGELHTSVAQLLDSLHGDLTEPLVEVEDGPEPGDRTVWVSAWSADEAVGAAREKVTQLVQ